jgi:uncharacterized protein (TIGR00369 family)
MSNDAGMLPADYHLQRLRQNWEQSRMVKTMGMWLIDAADGSATLGALAAEQYYNPQMRAHGGFAATLIDSAMGCAVFTKLPQEMGYGTIELKVNYVGKLDESAGPVTCIGTVIHAGRTMFTAEARLIGASGKLYAHGSGTFLVYPG